jgi:hypothetical protein
MLLFGELFQIKCTTTIKMIFPRAFRQHLSNCFPRFHCGPGRCLLSPSSSVRNWVNEYDYPEKTTSEVARHLITVTNIIIMPAASGLFFIRLSAVYSHSKYVMIPFGFCWLGVLGIFSYISIEGMARCSGVNRSTQCFEVQPIDAWGYIATAIYDTFMYLAISWQLASFAAVDRWQDRLKSFVTGDGLGWLSKVLLQGGQVYYL